jgi:NAD-dependent DNA ligase
MTWWLRSKNHDAVYYDSARLAKRAVDELMGMLQMMVADGVVHEREIAFLRDWLRQHQEVAHTWPADVLAGRIEHIAVHGVTSEEQASIIQLVEDVTGRNAGDAAAETKTVQIGFDAPAQIPFRGSRFCLTGQFLYGARSRCEAATEERGGECQRHVTQQTDFLVVGLHASPEWLHATYGTKIAEALALRESQKCHIAIVSEERWTQALREVSIAAASSASAPSSAADQASATLGALLWAARIPRVGEDAARRIGDRFLTFDALLLAGLDDVLEVQQVGPVTAANVIRACHERECDFREAIAAMKASQ